MSNSVVQDIKELMLARIDKECFLVVMILDLVFEDSKIQDFTYIPFRRILRKPSSLEKGTYYKEVVHKLEGRIPSSPPIPPSIYALLSLFSSQPLSKQLLHSFYYIFLTPSSFTIACGYVVHVAPRTVPRGPTKKCLMSE